MIAEKLNLYLRNKGIKQSHLARKLDVPIASFNGMLSGRQKLPADLFFEICHELNVDPMDFVPEGLTP